MTKNILVVDDSFIMRTIIKDIIESDPDLKVVGFAENGKVGTRDQPAPRNPGLD